MKFFLRTFKSFQNRDFLWKYVNDCSRGLFSRIGICSVLFQFLNPSPFEPTPIWKNMSYSPPLLIPTTCIQSHHRCSHHICHTHPHPNSSFHLYPHSLSMSPIPPTSSPHTYHSFPYHNRQIRSKHLLKNSYTGYRNHRLSPESNPSCKKFFPLKIIKSTTNVCLCQCCFFFWGGRTGTYI